MKFGKVFFGLVTIALCISASGWAQENARSERDRDPNKVFRAVLDLSDGSRLVGMPLEESLQVKTTTMNLDIPLAKIRFCEVRDQGTQIILDLLNGDKITGSIQMPKFRIQTIMGQLAPEFRNITRITFGNGNTPEIEARGVAAPDPQIPTITFGGVKWVPWHTLFEVQGDKLVSLPKARPEFNYGHSGSGRGPVLMTGLGSQDWKDYSVEFDFCATGMDPAFNPYNVGADYHDGAIFFHCATGHESWNVRGGSGYTLNVHGNGQWELTCAYNNYCPAPVGYAPPVNDGSRDLAKGDGLKIDRQNGNRFRIDVIGHRIQIWVDGNRIVDLVDDKMGEAIGGTTIDHGGVGVHYGFDSMGWIRNFSVRRF